MPQLDAYLFFDGTCAEAMRFYERTLGGRLEAIMTYADAPPGDQGAPADPNRVMHTTLHLGDRMIMASDSPPGQPHAPMQGFSLSLSYDDVEEGRKAFEALAEGGRVTAPFGRTFWAAGFGMLVDRYGTPWMVNVSG